MKHMPSRLSGALVIGLALSGSAWADKASIEKLNAEWDKTFNSANAAALAAQ